MTIFDIVNSILFNKNKNCLTNQDEENIFSPYLVNRWVSMYSPTTALQSNIINKYLGIFDNKIDLYRMFVNIMPKVSPRKIIYFKKNKKDVEVDANIELLAKSYEISEREINNYIAFLKK